MSKSKSATYRIIYRGAKGFTQVRYARTFEIWLGKRRILPPTAFPTPKKKAADRRSYLQRKVNRIERERQKILRARGEARALKAKQIREAKLKAEQRKQVLRERAKQKRIAKRILEQETEQVREDKKIEKKEAPKREVTPEQSRLLDLLSKESPDFKNQYQEEPQTLKQATIRDVVITPIKPKNPTYTKRIVDKTIYTNHKTEILNMTILDFDLKEQHIIPMDEDTIESAYTETWRLFWPHVVSFYDTVFSSTDDYILRLKFSFIPKGKRGYVSQGISLHRQDIQDSDKLAAIFRSTFRKFMGTEDPRTKEIWTKNYLAYQTLVYITGFTLEANQYI